MRTTIATDLPGTADREYYYLKEAARVLGYRNPNTVRNKHLTSPNALGKEYLGGSIVLNKQAVHELARRLERERELRGPDWRSRNLGLYNGPLRPRRGTKVETSV